jgi:DNA-binding NtrC family response regulator
MSARILVVEDDPVARRLLVEVLEREGHEVRGCPGARIALEEARTFRPAVVVTDVRLGGIDGLTLLREIRAADPAAQVIVMTAFGTLETAVEAIRGGAFDYVSKPFRMEEMSHTVHRAVEAHSAVSDPGTHEAGEKATILGRCPAMTEVFKAIARVGPLDISVLIEGETGTGKELVARAIHDAGDRARKPYVTVNCASLPEGLFESELFGHSKGAFTGAHEAGPGLFVAADGGTILLDEVGDMPLPVQAKLLRALETGEIRPVGSTKTRHVDVRVLASTHRQLDRSVEEGVFRQDLLYRLNGFTIALPPLRERGEDLALLTSHFLRVHGQAAGRPLPGLTPEAKAALGRYSWPGNVRELFHVLERAVALAKGPLLGVEDLPPYLREGALVRSSSVGGSAMTLDEVEKAHIIAVMRSTGGNRVRAAAILGIDRKTLYRKLQRYGLAEEAAET